MTLTSIIFGHQTHFTIQWIAITFRIFYFELTGKDFQSLNIENKFVLFTMASALLIIYDRSTQDYFLYLIQFFCNRARDFLKGHDNRYPIKSPKKERDSIHLPEIV